MEYSSGSRTSPSLLRRLKNEDDDEAWRAFVHRYGARIHAWCSRICRNPADADEAAQNVLVKLATAMRSFDYDPSRSFRAWLRTVADRAATDVIRQFGRGRGAGDSAVEEQLRQIPDGLANTLESLFEAEVLLEAMARVRVRAEAKGDRYWSVFEFRVLGDHSLAETADQFKMTKGAVAKMIYDTRRKIEAELTVLDAAEKD